MAQQAYITEENVEKYLCWEKLFARTEDAIKFYSHIFYDNPTVSKIILSKLTQPKVTQPQEKRVVAGCELTARRTAAATAVATRALLKEWTGQRILAIFGAGRQAYSHTRALTEIYKCGPDVEIRIWNHRYETAKNMAERLRAEGFNVTAMPDTEEGAKACAHNANLIVTATPSQKPVLKGAWVQPGAHVNDVGHHDEELSHVYALGVPIVGEIGEVLLGDLKLPASSAGADRPTTIFHSLGMAVEDTVSAQIVYDEYIKATKTK